MIASRPHFLLFSQSSQDATQGQWRFVLQAVDGPDQFEAADAEPDAQGERLELLAVVRGLEALPQPSRVTLVTTSRYVNRGLAYGLQEWRANGWQWECFGEMVPVKNRDLWQRVDRALRFHELDCRTWRFDAPHQPFGGPIGASPPCAAPTSRRERTSVAAQRRWWPLSLRFGGETGQCAAAWRVWAGQLRKRLNPLASTE
jgi:ribonuclease HI